MGVHLLCYRHPLTTGDVMKYYSRTGEGSSRQKHFAVLDEEAMRLSFGKDKGFICSTMRLYLRDAPKMGRKCREAIDTGNNQELAHAAHSLKGMTAYFSRAGLYDACLALEYLGKENGLPSESPQANKLYATLSSTMQDLTSAMYIYIDEVPLTESL